MSGTMEYKCPACGGSLAFDSASQKLKCPYCGSEYDIAQFEAPADKDAGKDTAAGGKKEQEKTKAGSKKDT